ncbi:hypothetical protein UPYG_G00249910 [Umbra pygmaea]|uniref:Uncharacterized protein n=1 Tax=Umbra pygmaea TaxID=75934 RepID=A0ABD0W7C3_UMBPY
MSRCSSVLQCLLLILLLAVTGQDCTSSRVQRAGRNKSRLTCAKNEISLCVDILKLQQLIQNVRKVFMNSSHDERILLQAVTFDKIKKHKMYHGCVLVKIVDFYQHVLERQDGDYTHLRGLLDEVKDCVVKNKTCRMLDREAAAMKVNEKKIEEDLELLSKDIAILQLQRLQIATERVVNESEQATIDKAMEELQQLDEYIKGKGLRKKMRKHYN